MKNIKRFFILASVATTFLTNACEEANNTSEAVDRQVSVALFDTGLDGVVTILPIDNECSEERMYFKQLFSECYRDNDINACKKLAELVEYQALYERQFAAELIHSQEKTNATLREALDLSHERERRKTAKINKRKQAKKAVQKAD
jgi:hypothetical protein